MNRGMHRETQAVDRHGDRVDEERHVVVDDLDHRVIGMPAVLFKVGVVYPQDLAARGEFLRRLPVRHGRAVEIGYIAALDVFGVRKLVVVGEEWFNDIERGLWKPSPCKVDYIGEKVRNAFFALGQHVVSRIFRVRCSDYAPSFMTLERSRSTVRGNPDPDANTNAD
jgi:hypothetical protein